MKLRLEETGDVERIFNIVIGKYPEEFEFISENAVFQFTVRENPTYDDDGLPIAATAARLSNRERDLYGSDFEICVHLDNWEELTDAQKIRLIYHELLHCWIARDEEDEDYPAYDKDDRVIIGMVPHDLVVRTFKAEIEQFGLQEGDLQLAEFFYKQYKKYMKQHGGK